MCLGRRSANVDDEGRVGEGRTDDKIEKLANLSLETEAFSGHE